jgi:hypothetical protein
MMTEDFLILKLLSLGMDASNCVDSNHFVDGKKCIKGYVTKLQRYFTSKCGPMLLAWIELIVWR